MPGLSLSNNTTNNWDRIQITTTRGQRLFRNNFCRVNGASAGIRGSVWYAFHDMRHGTGYSVLPHFSYIGVDLLPCKPAYCLAWRRVFQSHSTVNAEAETDTSISTLMLQSNKRTFKIVRRSVVHWRITFFRQTVLTLLDRLSSSNKQGIPTTKVIQDRI